MDNGRNLRSRRGNGNLRSRRGNGNHSHPFNDNAVFVSHLPDRNYIRFNYGHLQGRAHWPFIAGHVLSWIYYV
jgi:hypothetical protein